jgi:hypothetical protein
LRLKTIQFNPPPKKKKTVGFHRDIQKHFENKPGHFDHLSHLDRLPVLGEAARE